MLWWQQARALLWKCYIVRKRHPVTLAFELILPLALSLLVVGIMVAVLPDAPAGSPGPQEPVQPAYWPATIYPDPVYTFPGNIKRDLGGSFTILYAPDNTLTNQVVGRVVNIITDHVPAGSALITAVPFRDETSMLEYYYNASRSSGDKKVLVAFHDTEGATDVNKLTRLSYSIHPLPHTTPDVSTLFPHQTPRDRFYFNDNYYSTRSGFVTFQALINEAFLKLKAEARGIPSNLMSWNAWKFPYPKYLKQTQATTLTAMISPLIIFGFIVTFPIIVKRIAEEKVNKSREMFRIMGMSDSVYWVTTFLSFFLIYIVQAAILTFLLTHKWKGISIVNGVDTTVMFAIFLLYGAGLLTFGMFLAIPFTKPVMAVVFAVIIATITYSIPIRLLDPVLGEVDPVATDLPRYLCCLLPNFSFAIAISLISRRAMYSETVSWSNLFDSNSSFSFGTMSLGNAMAMMVVQILTYSTLIWYFDKVWPWQDGVPQPWYFPFQVQYWKSVFSFKDEASDIKVENLDRGPNSRYFERQLSQATNVISIRKLRKRFGNKMAVDGVDMDVKQGEITCLLGHNGAGKTTTMSMITGLFPATEGTIIVNGYDVASQTSKARESISLCPQHNVLYDELNVLEHLKLYAAIKGLPWSECGPSAIKQANVTQLGECLTKLPSQLSGGMKRKLCLGIALVGDTQLVILDEPTSGLDPEARRMIWDVLREVRRERTILLTTHYMEEADALADSIAIMTAGKVSCHGTPMYLKKLFSTGYMLRVAKGVGYDGQAVEELVREYFPRGGVRSEIDTEVIFALESQNGQTDSSKLPPFFGHLEQLKPKLGVASFGLSLTTLEDVFLKVGQMESSNEETQSHESVSIRPNQDGFENHRSHSSQETLDLDPNDVRPERVEGHALMYQRFKGLFLKRVHFGKRYWPMLTMQMAIPAIVFGLAMLMSNVSMSADSGPGQLQVTAIKQLYGETNGFVKGTNWSHFESAGKQQGIKFDHLDPSTNVSAYLLDVADKAGLNDYIRKNLFGVTLDQESEKETYNLWYQYEALHTLPAVVNLLYESRWSQLTNEKIRIDVTSVPLKVKNGHFQMKLTPQGLTTMLAILVGLSVPFLTASYVLFPVHERASQSKLLQLMTGLPVWLFWLASLLFDLASHLIASIFILTVVALVDNNSTFTNGFETIFSLISLLMLNGLAAIPIAYCFSCLVKKPASGFASLVTIYIVTGIIFSAMAPSLKLLQSDTAAFYSSLMKISPMYSLATGVTKVYEYGLLSSLCAKVSEETLQQQCPVWGDITPCCPEEICKIGDKCIGSLGSWSSKGIYQEVVMITIGFVIFSAILIATEYGLSWLDKLLHRSSDSPVLQRQQEDDVSREANRVEGLAVSNHHGDEALIVHNLTRKFGNAVAVNNLSFGVHKEEIFGLLGVNGAGKTTTFKMLTGDIVPTAGDARSGPLSIVDQRSDFQQQLGYCPQFDALLDKLTGSETLFLFGRLRGIPEYLLRRKVNQLIVMSDLTKHAHKPTEAYSGGNKRKLSLAIALIGSPKLLLLDEPTAGVDPGARRKIWTTLSHVREHYGCSIILTSHSMEECEALCSRLAIMVNGQFRCFGPVQHLRNKYGQGYTVIIKIKRDRLDTSMEVRQAMQNSIRGAVVRDAHETVIDYHVTDTTVTWAELFENLERIKQTFDLEDYSVSDTTLEQIFISFARGQSGANMPR